MFSILLEEKSTTNILKKYKGKGKKRKIKTFDLRQLETTILSPRLKNKLFRNKFSGAEMYRLTGNQI